MNYLRKGKSTSEFKSSLLMLAVVVCINFIFNLGYTYCYAIAIIVDSYILSRCLFKNNRPNFVGSGVKSTEFFFYCLGLICLILGLFVDKNILNHLILNAAFIQFAFNISRGHSKGESLKVSSKVQLIS